MSPSQYGHRFNPYRYNFGAKGVRQSVIITNNPSTIDQNLQLLVQFPNLGAHNVIIPETSRFGLLN